MDDYAAFDRKCSNLPGIEKKRLRYFVQLLDAVRGDSREKLRDVAHSIALLDSSPSPAIQDEIVANPMVFLQDELTVRSGASLVLWQERNGKLSPGLFCRDMSNALHTLMLIYVGSGKASKTGECLVCGKFIAKERGDRRKTCSDLCRKRASLRNRENCRAEGSHSRINYLVPCPCLPSRINSFNASNGTTRRRPRRIVLNLPSFA